MTCPNNSKLQSSKLLAIIPARGGSKGLPRKNLLLAGGKPLIAWTIDAALNSKYITSVVLSSDDDEIILTAKNFGCKHAIKRPDELANDSASSVDVVLHALSQYQGYDYVVLLQPTSPLRTSLDIDNAFELILSSNAPCCLSVCEVDQSPYWMYRVDHNEVMTKLLREEKVMTRRQDLPAIHILNGAIYIAEIDWLKSGKSFYGADCVAYRMPKEKSLDIDNSEDLDKLRLLIER